jgi:dynein heavy chain
MTISARGIIHFVDNEAYFISLEEWEREYRLYSELRKIKFFKNYRKWKNFTL